MKAQKITKKKGEKMMKEIKPGDLVMQYSWPQMQRGIEGPGRVISIIEVTKKLDIDGIKIIKARVEHLITGEIVEKHVSQLFEDCIANWLKIDEERDRVIITIKVKAR